MPKEITPLEQLVSANEQFGQTRKRKASPNKNLGSGTQRYYRTQLRSLVSLISKEIEAEVLPIVKQEKSQYQTDSVPTMDGWSDRVISALRRLTELFMSS